MNQQKIVLIVAVDAKYGISKNGVIPWKITEDYNFFHDVTTREYTQGRKNVLIMGKNTWKSLPSNLRGLKNRITVIVSSTMTEEELKQDNMLGEEVYLVSNFTDAITTNILTSLKIWDNIGYVFICGGSQIYQEALDQLDIDYYYITEIDEDYECDNLFPYDKLIPRITDYRTDGNLIKNAEIMDQKKFTVMDQVKNKKVKCTFTKYRNLMTEPDNIMLTNPEEQQYLNLLNEIITKGHYRPTRNSNTWSLFGKTMEFDLNKGFPLLTTKKVFFRGVFEELLFFLKGDTNAKHLSDNGVKIWEGNTSREFLDKNGLGHYEVGDMGGMYGYNFLHFGYPYAGMNTNYDQKGFNQIEYCLKLLKTDPYSRRILLTSFNPSTANTGVLYPCHSIVIQFYVDGDNKLSASCYNRSQDFLLGNPFNLCSTSLLIHMFCEVINNDPNYIGNKLLPGRLLMNMGDVHIYQDHYSESIRQILRDPHPFPQIKFNRKVTDLIEFKFTDIELIDYTSYPNIPAKMVA